MRGARSHLDRGDLRWGITTEEASEGKVLPLCLAEIHRCRPYFIGLLGERYGWVPDSIPADLLESQAWLKEHLEHSVTELEILHGVLREKEMHGLAYFYFRDPKYSDSVPDFIEKSTQAAEKLAKLKQKIRNAHNEKIKKYVNCAKVMQIQNSSVSGYWKISQRSLTGSIQKTRYQTRSTRKLCATKHMLRAAGSFVGRSELLRQMDEHAGKAEVAGLPFEPRPAHKPWEILPEIFRESNRLAADHLAVKLRAVGLCMDMPGKPGACKSFSDPDNTLAMMEHERWCTERWLDGWRLGERDDKEKVHPDLKPWDELPVEERHIDQNFVAKTVRIVARAERALYPSSPKNDDAVIEIGNFAGFPVS